MKKIIIIGNKPYFNINLNNIVDSFSKNCRCNLAMPNRNNGTKYNHLALCNHLYEKLIKNPSKYGKEKFIKSYMHAYKLEEMKLYLDKYRNKLSNYTSVFYANSYVGQNYCNKFLKKIGCPYYFETYPRTGYVALFGFLMRGEEVFIANFSVQMEPRHSVYVKECAENPGCHSIKNEINIIRWLHQNKKIDVTLCLLEDKQIPTIKCNGLVPSKFIIDKLISEFGDCKVEE